MNAKEYLSQVRNLDKEINAKLELREQLMSLATRMSAGMRLDNVSADTYNYDRIGDCVAKLVDLERELNGKIDKLVDLKRDAIAKIDAVENSDYRLLLTLRYINCLDWEDVAKTMSSKRRRYSVQHIRGYLHEQALATCSHRLHS